jgi:hypothetical protein
MVSRPSSSYTHRHRCRPLRESLINGETTAAQYFIHCHPTMKIDSLGALHNNPHNWLCQCHFYETGSDLRYEFFNADTDTNLETGHSVTGTQLAEAFAYRGLTVFTGCSPNYAQTDPDVRMRRLASTPALAAIKYPALYFGLCSGDLLPASGLTLGAGNCSGRDSKQQI